jgi:lipopolysaccharide export system permease protein
LYFGILPRSILGELLKVTLLALSALSALLMTGGAMFEAAKNDLDPWRVLTITPLLIPPTLPFTVPVCLLLACTVVYGRMSAAVEITALKAGGISAMRVLWPAISLGVALAALGIYLSDRFIPACNRTVAELLLSDVEANIYAYLRQRGSIVAPDYPYELYVRGVRGDRLMGAIIKHRTAAGSYDLVAQAEEATLAVHQPIQPPGQEPILVLRLREGVATMNGSSVHFRDRTQQMPIPKIIGADEQQAEVLSFRGCFEQAANNREMARQRERQFASAGLDAALSGTPLGVAEEFPTYVRETTQLARAAREAEAEVYLRIVQASAALPFVLLGCPMAVWFQQREYLHTFFVCFLPIVTLFYPMMLLTFNFFKESAACPATSLGLPSAILTVLALPLLRRVLRY